MEWGEFEEHFDRHKVELGSCGRPSGTPCQHEHELGAGPRALINRELVGAMARRGLY